MRRTGVSPHDVTYKLVPSRFENGADLKGGHGLVMVNDQGQAVGCTAGFAVKTSTGKRGVLTAGHCHTPGAFGIVYRDASRPCPSPSSTSSGSSTASRTVACTTRP